MSRTRALATVLLLACAAAQGAPPHTAAAPHAPAADTASLAGTYHLEGVMETGSDLRLGADGTFDWAFTYGALDLLAKGRWQREGDGIALQVEHLAFPPPVPQASFDRMHLRLEGATLVPSWPWDMDDFRKGAERGAYTRE